MSGDVQPRKRKDKKRKKGKHPSKIIPWHNPKRHRWTLGTASVVHRCRRVGSFNLELFISLCEKSLNRYFRVAALRRFAFAFSTRWTDRHFSRINFPKRTRDTITQTDHNRCRRRRDMHKDRDYRNTHRSQDGTREESERSVLVAGWLTK